MVVARGPARTSGESGGDGEARAVVVGARESSPEPVHDAGWIVRAPMPGRIVEVAVSPGQAVASGSLLLVVEAMKMQNELLASGPGRVEAVLVRVGDAVERGAEL